MSLFNKGSTKKIWLAISLSGDSSAGEFTHINMPAIKENEEITWYDKRKEGEILWPYQNSKEELELIKEKSPVIYATQFAQRPSPEEGDIIKRAYFRYYTVVPQSFEYVLYSFDMNFSESGKSNVCYSCYGVNVPKIYLLDQIVGRWDFVRALEFSKSFIGRKKRI